LEKEVEARLTEAIAERESSPLHTSITVGAYLDYWLAAIQDTLKPSSFRRYEEASRIHIKPRIGAVKLRKLNHMQLQALYRERGKYLSPRTVQIIHATLHKALKQAVRWQLVPLNVAAAVDPPRAPKAEIKPLTAAQAKTLLAVAKDTQPDLYALYLLAITTGMRSGELVKSTAYQIVGSDSYYSKTAYFRVRSLVTDTGFCSVTA
jgi:integrase